MITFEQCMEDRGLKLMEWQKEAARAFLKAVYGKGTGKTFLMYCMKRFLDEYGNCFGLDGEPEPVKEPKGPTVINDMYSGKEREG